MDLDLPTQAKHQRSNNLDECHGWRIDQLMQHGYTHALAVELALNPDVDLHQACDLLDRGCTQDLARRILT